MKRAFGYVCITLAILSALGTVLQIIDPTERISLDYLAFAAAASFLLLVLGRRLLQAKRPNPGPRQEPPPPPPQ